MAIIHNLIKFGKRELIDIEKVDMSIVLASLFTEMTRTGFHASNYYEALVFRASLDKEALNKTNLTMLADDIDFPVSNAAKIQLSRGSGPQQLRTIRLLMILSNANKGEGVRTFRYAGKRSVSKHLRTVNMYFEAVWKLLHDSYSDPKPRQRKLNLVMEHITPGSELYQAFRAWEYSRYPSLFVNKFWAEWSMEQILNLDDGAEFFVPTTAGSALNKDPAEYPAPFYRIAKTTLQNRARDEGVISCTKVSGVNNSWFTKMKLTRMDWFGL